MVSLIIVKNCIASTVLGRANVVRGTLMKSAFESEAVRRCNELGANPKAGATMAHVSAISSQLS